MADSRHAPDVFWVEPKRRAILPLEQFRMSRSLRKIVRGGVFDLSVDRAFPAVVRHCATRAETWINAGIEASYNQLHRKGHAHSIECWSGEELVGGLYGVRLGGAFFGESMFSLRPDASKVALAWLVARLRVGGFRLLDCQFMTPHLASLGAIEILQKDYIALLSTALSPAGSGDAAGGGRVEFGALDRFLAGAAERSGGGTPPGWVIAQLLGQTS